VVCRSHGRGEFGGSGVPPFETAPQDNVNPRAPFAEKRKECGTPNCKFKCKGKSTSALTIVVLSSRFPVSQNANTEELRRAKGRPPV
jgi:hypothetical protein